MRLIGLAVSLTLAEFVPIARCLVEAHFQARVICADEILDGLRE